MHSLSSNRLVWMSMICAVFSLGCESKTVVKNDQNGPQDAVEKMSDSAEAPGYLEQANQLFQKAKDAGQTTAGNASEWISDTVSGAMDATGSAAQETGDWVTDTYESLRDQGLTTAGDAKEWVREDLKNINSFEYKVVSKNLSTAEEELNQLGNARWECFAVDDQAFYLKRRSKSYLRHVPVKDLLKFLPVGASEE